MKIKETHGKVSEAHEKIASRLPSASTRQLCVRRQHATLSMRLCTFSPVNRLIFKHNLSTGYYEFNDQFIYCVRGTRTQPLISVGCPVQLIGESF